LKAKAGAVVRRERERERRRERERERKRERERREREKSPLGFRTIERERESRLHSLRLQTAAGDKNTQDSARPAKTKGRPLCSRAQCNRGTW
jgi:hypothetical protein